MLNHAIEQNLAASSRTLQRWKYWKYFQIIVDTSDDVRSETARFTCTTDEGGVSRIDDFLFIPAYVVFLLF
jgi:hypothetical protein